MSDFYGGGGYDSNAGGYDANASPSNGSPGGERKAGDRSEQNLLPVTIKQMNDADEEGNTFTIDGKTVYQVSFIAAIRDTTENSTNISFVLEDGTGEIVSKLFVDESESDSAAMQRAQWKAGKYVRVIGMIRAHNGRRSVVAYNIQLVTDYNQVTYHFLKVMHVHAIMAKKNGVQPQASSSSNLVHAAVPQGNSLLAESAANNDGINDPVQLSVLSVFQSESKYVDDTGLDIKIIVQKLIGQQSADDVRRAIAQLSEDGHIYSTIDDDHYMLT
eukprot:INCI761.1.p1 GENE.INCI761.1~~INCI761.1.p1  ORF type:complete len:273 (-),score=59.89 INCI761.1:126-944(-)